jgi:hypothetical protein
VNQRCVHVPVPIGSPVCVFCLCRQQLIACARKLELGQMSATQFVDQMRALGVSAAPALYTPSEYPGLDGATSIIGGG